MTNELGAGDRVGPERLHVDRLQVLIHKAPVAFWTCLPDGNADFLNERWLNYLALSPDRAKGLGWSEILHPDDAQGHLEAWQRAVTEETKFVFESRIRRFDGEYRWHLALAEPVRDESGRVIIWCGTNIDIEDRKRGEAVLQRNETYLSEAQRLSRTGSFSWVPTTGHMHWSEESFRLFGIPSGTAATMALLECFIHSDDRQEFYAATRKAKTREPFDIRSRIRLATADIKHVRIVGRPLDLADAPLTYAGAFMDFTDAKLAEEQLHNAHSALAHVTRVVTLGELAASIAHEINQPLTGIVSNGEACVRWLSRDTPDWSEVRRGVEQMVADSRRAAEVIRRLRTLVRKADPEYEPIDINTLVNETIPLIQREIADHRATLELALATNLPAIAGDKVQLQQVLINLIMNGLQAMNALEGGTGHLAIRTEQVEALSVRVSVTDVGTGINAAHLANLFEPFFTTKSAGLGMGLSICRSIIEAHGGEIFASNNDIAGATVSFLVPATARDSQNG